VLSRAERVARLITEERFAEDSSPLGLPKVAHRKAHAGKKKVKKEEGTAEGAAPSA